MKWYEKLKKGDYVVSLAKFYFYREENTIYIVNKDFNGQINYGLKENTTSTVDEFRLATPEEAELCKSNDNKPTHINFLFNDEMGNPIHNDTRVWVINRLGLDSIHENGYIYNTPQTDTDVFAYFVNKRDADAFINKDNVKVGDIVVVTEIIIGNRANLGHICILEEIYIDSNAQYSVSSSTNRQGDGYRDSWCASVRKANKHEIFAYEAGCLTLDEYDKMVFAYPFKPSECINTTNGFYDDLIEKDVLYKFQDLEKKAPYVTITQDSVRELLNNSKYTAGADPIGYKHTINFNQPKKLTKEKADGWLDAFQNQYHEYNIRQATEFLNSIRERQAERESGTGLWEKIQDDIKSVSGVNDAMRGDSDITIIKKKSNKHKLIQVSI